MLLGGIVADDQAGGYVLLMLSLVLPLFDLCVGRDGSDSGVGVRCLERCLSWPVFFTSKFESPKKGVERFKRTKR